MEVGPITPAQATEKALAAWAAAVEAIHADGAPAPGVPVAGEVSGSGPVDASVPVSEPALPGSDADAGHEAATVQSLWRAPTPQAEATRAPLTASPDAPAAQADAALPDALLAPATLIGLRAEPSMAWSLPTPPVPWTPPPQARERRHERRERDEPRRDDPQQAATDASAPLSTHEHGTGAQPVVIDPDDDGQWCEPLTRGLQAQLAGLVVPPALMAAAEQWTRGRCVVLSCPQRDDPAHGWSHVLWPRPEHSGILALRGLRVEALLQWRVLPAARRWLHARMVREHHPRHGRQLTPADTPSANTVLACEVQLGPQLERVPRRCEVRVQIRSAQRFWAALGSQWSVLVVVSAQPLLAAQPRHTEALPC
jgi:hypothetical protein